MNTFVHAIQRVFKNDDDYPAPTLVHVDIFRAKASITSTADPELMLSRHLNALLVICGDRPLFMPSFNYDFVQTGVYRPNHDISQVGALTDYARTKWAKQRCGPPIINFSCALDNIAIPSTGDIDPYGANTVFGFLHRAAGKVLMYGAPFSSFTFIHYIERLMGGPAYRYDKCFQGVVRGTADFDIPVKLNYHCRPMGRILEYDWTKLRLDAESQGIIQVLRAQGSEVLIVDISKICEFWQDNLHFDPLYLLNQDTRIWVDKELNRLGRRFDIRDFEEIRE